MMGSAFYVMAILGCSDAGTACEQVRIEQTRFVSADACSAATSAAVLGNSDVAFPVVVAECRQAGEMLAEQPTKRPRS